MQNIVVGVDGSEPAAAALRWAVEEAKLRDWHVTAVMAWSYVRQIHASGGPEFEAEYGASQARKALATFVRQAVGDDPGVAISESVICDLPASALLHASGGANLLVLGGRGLGGIKGLLLGSVSQACLHRCMRPVVIVHADPPPRGDRPFRIVVGVDGSSESTRALEWALHEARHRHAELEVVSTWQVPVGEIYPWLGPVEYTPVEQQSKDLIEEMLEHVDVTGLDHEITRTVMQGSPIPTLLEAAGGADLVVVGGRGVSGFAGMVLGSVSHALAHRAPCPVMVLPEWSDAAVGERHRVGVGPESEGVSA